MSEIRNLTRNGETFYPQTHVEGVLDPNGNYIGYYVDNPEWIRVITDSDGKILVGIKPDGSIEWSVGIPQPIKNYIQEYVIISLQDKVDKEEGKSLINSEVASSLDYKESPEFLSVELDANEQVLGGRRIDGTKFENVGLDLGGGLIKGMDDPEGRIEIKTDSDDKIISYRKNDGTLIENVGIETSHLELTEQGMNDFQKALRDSGFQPGGAGDWSDKDSMYIPEPRLAHFNIITDFNLTSLTKSSDVKCAVEFYDGSGNYFKKWIILNGQGRSSMSFLKKGLGADFFNEDPNSPDFDEDNVFSMKFGDWVPQDSYHIKSYYTDWPRCTSPVVYKLTDEVVRTRGVMNDRPYKKYYVGEYSDAANANTQSDLDKNMETGARCFPDGFPVIVYQNGEFWGVNSWQLKKHRDNYAQSKKKSTHIHLDGDMGTSHWKEVTPPQPTPWIPFWLWNGTINWEVYCSGKAGIETRNPKNLYCIDGKKYDADSHDAEIITTATAEEWITAGQIIPTGKTIDDELAGYLRTTGKVRKSIEDLTTYVPTIRQMATISTNNGDIMIGAFGGNYDATKNFGKGVWVISEGRNYMSIHSSNTGNPITDTNNWVDITDALADVKETIEDMFDLDTFIDFIVIGNVCGNNDAWDNNGQIITWGKFDGSNRMNWSVNMYDCDITFGCQWDGRVATAADNAKLGSNYPLYSIFWNYYFEELKARYHELRDKGIFDADHITQLFRNWMDRVGYDNYSKEYEKWNESPCFRDGNETYTNYPTTGGFYGSIERIYLWIKKRIQYMDAADFFDYNN